MLSIYKNIKYTPKNNRKENHKSYLQEGSRIFIIHDFINKGTYQFGSNYRYKHIYKPPAEKNRKVGNIVSHILVQKLYRSKII